MAWYLDKNVALRVQPPTTILLFYAIESGSCRSECAGSADQVPLRIAVQQTANDGSKAVSIPAIYLVLLLCPSLSVYEHHNNPILTLVLLLDATAANEMCVVTWTNSW